MKRFSLSLSFCVDDKTEKRNNEWSVVWGCGFMSCYAIPNGLNIWEESDAEFRFFCRVWLESLSSVYWSVKRYRELNRGHKVERRVELKKLIIGLISLNRHWSHSISLFYLRLTSYYKASIEWNSLSCEAHAKLDLSSINKQNNDEDRRTVNSSSALEKISLHQSNVD